MGEPSSRELFALYKSGDSKAAGEIYDHYVARLIGLVRKRLSSKLSRRVDPEDIVQSAYRSFFLRARDEQYVLDEAGDLWRLLVGITLNKLYGQVERHTAARRDVAREEQVCIGRGACDRTRCAPANACGRGGAVRTAQTGDETPLSACSASRRITAAW